MATAPSPFASEVPGQSLPYPQPLDTASRLGPHVPGEFPTETGEDPHVPGSFPITPDERPGQTVGVAYPFDGNEKSVQAEQTSSTASRGALGTAAGATAGGVGLAGYQASRSENDPLGGSTYRTQAENRDAFQGSPDTTGVGLPTSAPAVSTYETSRSATNNASYQQPEARDYQNDSESSGQSQGYMAAAAATVAGAAGGAAYYATRAKDTVVGPSGDTQQSVEQSQTQYSRDPNSTMAQPQGQYVRDASTTLPHSQPQYTQHPSTTVQQSQYAGGPVTTERTQAPTESNYSRDAAITGGTAAGVGAVGAGAYYTTRDEDTGPASKTIGPHKSNIMNILDPRVKPEPEKMKEKEPITTGPYKSDMANMADPRVKQSAPVQAQPSQDNQYGRDAALVGAGGAATGAGAYGYSQYSQQQTEDPRLQETTRQQAQPTQETQHKRDTTTTRTEKHSYSAEKQYHPAEKQSYPSEKQSPSTPAKDSQDSHYGRDATAAGAGATAIGGVAYEDTKEPEEETPQSPHSPDSRVAVDSYGHNRLHKKRVEQPAESKPGLVHRMLHRDKSKRESSGSTGENRSSAEYGTPSSPTSTQQASSSPPTQDATY